MKFLRISLILFSISCACFGQSARDIARNAFKSVVILEMNDSNGQPLSLGSGFFISNGIIATNAHVIEGAFSGTAKLIGDTHTLQILGTVAVDRHADLALLKVSSTAPSLILGPNTSPTVGDNVYVVGNPLGLEGTFSEGIISGVRHVDADSILQMTASISPGSSGGPVMDSSGAVIGIAVATFRDGQNLNFAIPVAELSKLLTSITPSTSVISLGKQKTNSITQKSIVDGIGTRVESGVVASNFAFSWMGCSFRLTNKLPVGIFNIRVRIIFYDASQSIMDFEDFIEYPPDLDPQHARYDDLSHNRFNNLPSGLTKPFDESSTAAPRAAGYYLEHEVDGSVKKHSHSKQTMKPIVEMRVISFSTVDSQ